MKLRCRQTEEKEEIGKTITSLVEVGAEKVDVQTVVQEEDFVTTLLYPPLPFVLFNLYAAKLLENLGFLFLTSDSKTSVSGSNLSAVVVVVVSVC